MCYVGILNKINRRLILEIERESYCGYFYLFLYLEFFFMFF